MIQWLDGDCRAVLPTLAPQSVHCVVTSPPYWGLRDYGIHDAGGIGLEATFADWLSNMVDAMRGVWRVLRDDGTLWLNMGDAYAQNGAMASRSACQPSGARERRTSGRPPDGLKPKDLIGQPWALAFALRDDGWYLRSDIIWHKPNPMPESVQDRPTKSHEYLFLLTKRPRYFYDAEAVRESAEYEGDTRHLRGDISKLNGGPRQDNGGPRQDNGSRARTGNPTTGRNKRSVWTIPTQPYSAAHFATFSPALVEPCIKAGTSLHGCCAACGAPWQRVVERKETSERQTTGRGWDTSTGNGGHGAFHRHGRDVVAREHPVYHTVTTGWTPGCTCEAAVVPATVLDPFGGAGTTALVADRLGRHAISIELNPEYMALARARVCDEAPLFHARAGA